MTNQLRISLKPPIKLVLISCVILHCRLWSQSAFQKLVSFTISYRKGRAHIISNVTKELRLTKTKKAGTCMDIWEGVVCLRVTEDQVNTHIILTRHRHKAPSLYAGERVNTSRYYFPDLR